MENRRRTLIAPRFKQRPKTVLTLVCVLFLLTAVPFCAWGGDIDGAVKAVRTYYDLSRDGDIEGMKNCMTETYRAEFGERLTTDADTTRFSQLISSIGHFEIKNAEPKGQDVIVTVMLETVDFNALLDNAEKAALDTAGENFHDAFMAYAITALQNGDYDLVTVLVNARMTREDGAWKLMDLSMADDNAQ